MNQETYDRIRRHRPNRCVTWFLNLCFLARWLPSARVMRWARRVFYLPDTVLHNYRVRRFWRIAARQHQVARRLEWRLKNKP